jgi:putative MATE family efflux protein
MKLDRAFHLADACAGTRTAGTFRNDAGPLAVRTVVHDREKALGNGIFVSVILSLVVVAILLPLLDFWLKLIGASEDVLPIARDYMYYVTIGMIFQITSMALLNFARAEGNAKVGMIGMILGAFLSIALSAVFIIWLEMGVGGAGLAILLAQFVALIYLGSYYLFKKSYLKVYLPNFLPDLKIIKSILAVGIGAFTQHFAVSVSGMLLNSIIVTTGGDYALSAFGIVQRIFIFANLPAMVIGQGIMPIIGFNCGAWRWKLALKTIRLAYIASFLLSITSFLVVYFIPEYLVRIFTNDPVVLSLGTSAAGILLLGLPLLGPLHVGINIFQATGKALKAFIAALARPVAFLIPSAVIMVGFFGFNGIWASYPVADLLNLTLVTSMVIPVVKNFRSLAVRDEENSRNGILEQDEAN